jgi:hypothetical protein
MNVMEKRISVEEATEMTSKSKQLTEDQGIDWAEVLLRRFKKADEVFQQARQFNRDHGISDEVSKQYINYNKPLPQREYERFLNQCTNEDTGAWNTMSYLKATNQVSRKIESEFDGVIYPKVEILKIIRIKTRTGDFIYRVLNLIGLGKSGKEISQFVDDIDRERIPACEYVTLPAQSIPSGAEYEEEGFREDATLSDSHKVPENLDNSDNNQENTEDSILNTIPEEPERLDPPFQIPSHPSHPSPTEFRGLFKCYHPGCDFQTNDEKDYERHGALKHLENPLLYPSRYEIEKHGLKPQGKEWEV